MRIISNAELQQLAMVISKNDISVSQVLELIKKRNKVIDVTSIDIELIVDYSKSVEQAISEGNYDIKESDINANNFPVDPELIGKTVKVKSRLFNFDEPLISQRVIREMDQVDYRPANLMEILAFGAARPELQRVITIIAFGSRWEDHDGYYCLPALHVCNNKRYLNTALFAEMFTSSLFALGIPKESPK
ncbi:MAG: hypothetical protein WCK59_01190 [Candidatus Falkowbacteria bacterium]